MHPLMQLARRVNRTHRGLGRLAAFEALSAKAGKAVIVVAPAGCGKSVVSSALCKPQRERFFAFDSVTRSALKYIQDKLNYFDGLIVIDDLGKVDTEYSRMATITTFAELCYSHFIRKLTVALDIDIHDFNGSAIMNIQPVLFDDIVRSSEWEAVIRDKTIRYYHIVRPVKPEISLPTINYNLGLPLNKVQYPKRMPHKKHLLMTIGRAQWSASRAKEHLRDLLRASAALANRTEPSAGDYHVLSYLLKPMMAEKWLIGKTGFESGRYFLLNAQCILVEFMTWGNPTIEQICDDYKISQSTAYRIIEDQKDYCFINGNSPKKVMPTELSQRILQAVK